MKILVLNGPNLGRLGQRRPEVYGRETLDEIVARCSSRAGARGASLEHLQSNHEGALIDRLEMLDYDGVVINPGALGHTSYALRDAIGGIDRPVVEIHISNVHEREEFRRVLVLEDVVAAQVTGRGADGYLEAIDKVIELIGASR